MSEKDKTENFSAEENETSWFGSNLYRLMLIVTVVWFAIVLIYITQFFGWSNLFLMMPDEFGGFLAGATLPLALIWVGMAYVDRSAAFKREAKFLRAYMNQLVYPEEGESATAKAMSEAIRSQVAELQEVTKLAMSQTANIKKELDARVDDFASLVRVLDNYSTKSIVELTNGVKTLTRSFDGVTDKAFKTTKDLSSCISEFSSVAGRLQEDINGIVDNLLPGMHEIKNSADIIQTVAESSSRQIIEASESIRSYGSVSEENFNLVYEKIQAQSKYLQDITAQATESTKAVGETFRSVAEEIDKLIETRGRKTVEYAENMDNSIQNVCSRIAEHSEQFAGAAEKIIAQTATVENSISTQAAEMKSIADTVTGSLQQAESALSNGFENMDEQSTRAVEKLREAVDTLQVKTENLITFTGNACDRLESGCDTIDGRLAQMQNIGESAGGRLDEAGNRLSRRIAEVDKTVEEMLGKLNKVNETLVEQSEKISETGNTAVAQSRLAENSLSEQHSAVQASLAAIAGIRGELSAQIEELSTVAARVSEQTNKAVDSLRDNLSASLAASGEVAEQSKKINDALAEEVQRLGEAAAAASDKISGLDAAVASQGEQLRGLTDGIEEQTGRLSTVMERHASAVNEATEGFSSRFEEIVSTFESQSTLFNNVAENTAGVSRTIREQIASIGESADSVFAKMSALEEEVERRGSAVADKSKVAIDKLSEIDQAVGEKISRFNEDLDAVSGRLNSGLEEFGRSVEEVKNAGENAAQKIIGSMEQLRAVHGEFGSEFDRLTGNMTDYAEKIGGSVEQIHARGMEINDNFNAVLEQLRGEENRIADVFNVISERIGAQNAAINDNFARQREDLLDVVNQVSAQTRLGEAALNQQYKCLMDVADAVSEKMENLSRAFAGDSAGLQQNAAAAAENLAALAERLGEADAMLGQTAQNAVAGMEEVGRMLASCSENLGRATEDAAAGMNKMTEDYRQSLQNFSDVSDAGVRNANEAAGLLAEQNEKMTQISNDTKTLVDYFNNLMDNAANQLIEKANDAHDKIREQGESLQLLRRQLEETIAAGRESFGQTGEHLQACVAAAMADAGQLTDNVLTADETFRKQADALKETADETMNRVNEVMGSFSASLEEFTARGNEIVTGTDNFNKVVKKQIELLEIGAKQAGGELAEIEKRYREMKVENFLKNATSIIEKLETLAVDINQIFNPESQDKLWQKYYEGDTDAFVRYLSRSMSRKQVVAIKETFEGNQEFRRVVSSYMSEFEELINRARACEKSDLLLSVISGADVGKIYYVLARALDKLN